MALLLIRRTGQRSELDRVSQLLASLALLLNYSTQGDANIGNGTTAGRLRTNATAAYRIGTGAFSKPSTDNLWNLSAQTDTAAGEYKAFWLLLDGSLAGSIAAGTAQASAADALAALPALDGTKAVVGVFVAAPECDFDDAGGLAAQGTIHDGIPEGAALGGDLRHTYTADLPLFVYA